MREVIRDLSTNLGDRPNLALRLWLSGLALLVVFCAALLNAALPLKPADPRWLQSMIQALLSQGFLPLIALVLLHLAVVLHPSSTRLRRRRDRFSRFAGFAAAGFLLLIPLQLAASWGQLNQLAAGQQQQRLQAVAMVGTLRQAVNAGSLSGTACAGAQGRESSGQGQGGGHHSQAGFQQRQPGDRGGG